MTGVGPSVVLKLLCDGEGATDPFLAKIDRPFATTRVSFAKTSATLSSGSIATVPARSPDDRDGFAGTGVVRLAYALGRGLRLTCTARAMTVRQAARRSYR